MIVRNAEHKLGRTLDSCAGIFDEIIIVDTGSTDNTVSLAESYGVSVSHFEWIDDFAVARNFALQQCTGDWIMWLDSGDVLLPETIKQLNWIKNQPIMTDPRGEVNMIWSRLARQSTKQGEVVIQGVNARLARRRDIPNWIYAIHEALVVENPVAIMDEKLVIGDPEGSLVVAAERNLRIIDKCIAEGRDVVRCQILRNRELETLGRYQEVLDHVEEISLLPMSGQDLADAYLIAGRCCARTKNGKEREYYLRAMGSDPRRPDAFMYLGDLEFRNEHFERAIPYYLAASMAKQDLRDNLPLNVPFSTYAPYEKLAYCYLGMGDDKKSFFYFNLAINKAPVMVAKMLREILKQLKNKKGK